MNNDVFGKWVPVLLLHLRGNKVLTADGLASVTGISKGYAGSLLKHATEQNLCYAEKPFRSRDNRFSLEPFPPRQLPLPQARVAGADVYSDLANLWRIAQQHPEASPAGVRAIARDHLLQLMYGKGPKPKSA